MSKYRECAREVFEIESEAIRALIGRLDENFDRAVEHLLECKGRVIVAGMGKSGLIGKKIAATLTSTGISSFFMHPAEAMHGDLGLMRSDDLLLLISKSGQLEEMELLISAARRFGVKIVALCGTVGSDLYRRADVALDCSVEKEACPNDLVPTSSSTAALVMGDALAIALLKARNFTSSDFAALHPGGFLGKRLLRKVSELHHSGDQLPVVTPNASMNEMILEMTSKRLGCVIVKADSEPVGGIFTDGDLRRLVETRDEVLKLSARDVMITVPKTISVDAVLDAALALMEEHSIMQLITLDDNNQLAGVIHLHDILKSKLI
jgi:arabinose-5-phosphate isomerase